MKNLKKCHAVFAVTSGLMLFTGNSFAFNTWTGSKSFVDFRDHKITPIVVELNERHKTASVANSVSVGQGTFETTKNELKITFKTLMESVGYPTVLNPYTGNLEQTYTTVKFKTITITEEAENFFKINGQGETCYSFRVPGEGERIDCSDLTDDYDDAHFQKFEAPRAIKTSFKVGDKVVLPIGEMNSTFVEILEDGKVKNLLPETDVKPMQNLIAKNGQIVAKMEDGETITYSRLARSNGTELLIAVSKDNAGILKGMTSGTIYVDEKINTLAIDFTGTYNALGFGSTYFGGDEFLLNFFSDGFGGFEFYSASDDFSAETVWKWEPTPTGMKAQRFMMKDESGYSREMANSKEEIEACLAQERDCWVFQEREYRLIGKDGNKFVMLRKMESRFDLNADKSVHYVINFLYKK